MQESRYENRRNLHTHAQVSSHRRLLSDLSLSPFLLLILAACAGGGGGGGVKAVAPEDKDDNDKDAIQITGLTSQANGGDISVDEDDLASGSDTSKESLTRSGTFTLDAPGGVDSLTIGGKAVITDGNFAEAVDIAAPGNVGTLRITAFNADTGEVSYSFTLSDRVDHANGNGANDDFVSFMLELDPVNGDRVTNNLVVKIVDDVPMIAVVGSVDDLAVDESTLGTVATAEFANNFNVTAGADGQRGVTSYALSTVAGCDYAHGYGNR